jgi:type IV secretory pathway component VirB8
MLNKYYMLKSLFNKKTTEDEPIVKKPSVHKTMISEIKETFSEKKIYKARWIWYHTILAGELFLIIILLIAILTKI